MAQRGGISHIHYRETRGLKVAGGQSVTKSAILTREGNKWKPGKNVGGIGTLYALCDGEVYFTKKKGSYRTTKVYTVINIKPKVKKKS
ncbi:MAG: 50S ribosomal protein L27 [Candidatus Omnitrophica bacterium]|nr:50S ribosomal protein L27 [Candidatus Omnitrophota bacterium]HOX55232.1 50S ribosomal protein L27 [Candidatus Omnitrophota bacterium]